MIVKSMMKYDFKTELFPHSSDGLEKWSCPGQVTYRDYRHDIALGRVAPFLCLSPITSYTLEREVLILCFLLRLVLEEIHDSS